MRLDLSKFHKALGGANLGNIWIYWDFSWKNVFTHEAFQFNGGKRLAHLVCEDCRRAQPEGLQPALALTDKPGVREGPYIVNNLYVVVVHIRDYADFVTSKRPDPAATYFTARCRTPLTGLMQLEDALGSPEAIGKLAGMVEAHPERFEELIDAAERVRGKAGGAATVPERILDFTEEQLAMAKELAEADPGRVAGLASVLAPFAPSTGPSTQPDPRATTPVRVEDIASLLRTMDRLDGSTIEELIPVFDLLATPDGRRRVIDWAVNSHDGRLEVSRALSSQVAARLAETRAAAESFNALVEADAGETELQRFLESNPWILGMEYAAAMPEFPQARGRTDFLLKRFDGMHDIVEIKDAGNPIIDTLGESGKPGLPPPPSKHGLSKKLSNALAQAYIYRDMMNHGALRYHGLEVDVTEGPKVIIIIGRTGKLHGPRKIVLKELNRSMNRVEVIGFDEVALRAKTMLDNLEFQLKFVGPKGGPEDDSGTDAAAAPGAET